nr:MAG TPA: hypothetical protein [Caudoviricetes sp.]DAV61664.1 MAG TPA: hypothetical protein [Caudoviricetes sp.]
MLFRHLIIQSVIYFSKRHNHLITAPLGFMYKL